MYEIRSKSDLLKYVDDGPGHGVGENMPNYFAGHTNEYRIQIIFIFSPELAISQLSP